MGLIPVSLILVFLCLQQEGRGATLLGQFFNNLDPDPEW